MEDEHVEDGAEDSSTPEFSYLINTVYYDCIIENVKFSEVISKMPMMRSIAAQVFSLDGDGKTKEAGALFMNKLKLLPEQGKYQSLLHALKELGYARIVQAVEQGAVNDNHEEHRKILDLFMNPLQEKINPSIMAVAFLVKEVISSSDADKIQKTEMNKGTFWAAFELLDTIPRKSENWYEVFLDVLYDHEHYSLCKEIDPKFYSTKVNQETEDAAAIHPLPCIERGETTMEDVPHRGQAKFMEVVNTSNSSEQLDDTVLKGVSNMNKCNCSCVQSMDKKFEEMKAFFQLKVDNLEGTLNHQSKLLEALLSKCDQPS